MKRILAIIGTRPEAIKMAPVVHALRARPDSFEVRVCLTGQHREMLYQAIEYFELPIHYDLQLMKASQTLPQITATLVTHLDDVLADCAPEVVLVQGDTTTAFAGALAAFYRHLRVGHVEAGLRTGNRFSPFPEEMNRRLAGVLANDHFAPTEQARQSLLREGVPSATVIVTGNTVIDALNFTLRKIESNPPALGEIEAILNSGRRMVLITGHRRENFGQGFQNICEALRDLADAFPDIDMIYPVHLNPNVQKPVHTILGGHRNIHLVAPLPYVPFVRLMKAAYLILTDSGGIQEEAPTLGKPVLVMRDTTERPEAIAAGSAKLVGTDRHKIFTQASQLLTDTAAWEAMSRVNNPFGDGHAAERIADYLDSLPDDGKHKS